jgi:hypothetical protein
VTWTIKTYLVISSTSVVVEDISTGRTTNYAPGAVFEEAENNLSVQRLLEDQLIIEAVGQPVGGYVVVTGPTGPVSYQSLEETLAIGNYTGENDIWISPGRRIYGGRAAFGMSVAAAVDGDLSARAGNQEFFWNSSLGRTLITGQLNNKVGLEVTNNETVGAAAQSELVVINDGGASSGLTISGTAFAPAADGFSADWATLWSSASAGGMRIVVSSANPLELWTNGVPRWSVSSAGHLLESTGNTYDIGLLAGNRPRTIYVGTSVEVGVTLGPSALGDIRAGNGVNELFWDASAGVLTVDNLFVGGTTTTINTEVQTADNYILLNSNYTGDAPRAAGLVMNIDPSATTFSISGITSNEITVVAGDPSTALAAADFLLIQNPADTNNAGVYEVLSTTGSSVTIDSTPVEAFSGTGLTDDPTTQGTVVGVRVAAIRSDTTGTFQTGTGTAAPLSWTDAASGLVSYDTSALQVGDCVYISGADQVDLTDADSDSTSDFIGVVVIVGAMGTGQVGTGGDYPVRFAGGLTLNAGDPVFLSETTGTPTDGLATNVEPTTVGAVSYQIGYVKNASTYAGTEGQLAQVQLRYGGRVVIAV